MGHYFLGRQYVELKLFLQISKNQLQYCRENDMMWAKLKSPESLSNEGKTGSKKNSGYCYLY